MVDLSKRNEDSDEWLSEETTELEEYQEFVDSCPQPKDNDIKGFWAASQMTCEAAEVLTIFEKAFRKGKTIDLIHLEEELGDVLWGVACICNRYNISLDNVIMTNISKLKERHNV